MAEQDPEITPIDSTEPDATPGYVPPALKSLDEIKTLDADDESLVRYKQTLLAADADACPKDDPRKVVVQKMSLVVAGRDDVVLDLQATDLSQLRMVVKEGTEYKIRIDFKIQHEIVSGLRYFHVVKRKGISVDKQSYMVGSYGPKKETQSYLTPSDDAPSGMISRGSYVIHSKFLDDDKNVHLEWEWEMVIKKDWA